MPIECTECTFDFRRSNGAEQVSPEEKRRQSSLTSPVNREHPVPENTHRSKEEILHLVTQTEKRIEQAGIEIERKISYGDKGWLHFASTNPTDIEKIIQIGREVDPDVDVRTQKITLP